MRFVLSRFFLVGLFVAGVAAAQGTSVWESQRSQWYVNLTALVVKPDQNSFDGPVDVGLAGAVGIGRYLDLRHTIELDVEYDLQLYARVAYAYGIPLGSPLVEPAFQIGYKTRLAETKRYDNFVSAGEALPNHLLTLGVLLHLPIATNRITIGWHYWLGKKEVSVVQAGLRLIF